jgi:hypothetical protein
MIRCSAPVVFVVGTVLLCGGVRGAAAQAPPPTADTADVQGAYDRAFAALLRRDWATATALFDEVAARSVEADRRAAARELARFARSASVADASAASDLDVEDRTSGRASFVVSTTLASFYAGFVLDDLLAIASYEGTVAAVTATTAAGLTSSLFGSRAFTISEGTASAYSTGILVGLGNGLLLAPPLGIDADAECGEICGDGEVNQAYLGFGLGTMIVGGAAGAYLGHRFDPTAPQGRLVSLLAFNGLVTAGLMTAMLAGDDSDLNSDDVLLILGGGLDAGLAAGIAVAPRLDWSGARTTYVTLGEAVGALGGFAVAAMAVGDDDGSEEAYAGLILGGTWAGFAGAVYLTSGMTPHRRYQRVASSTVALTPTWSSDGGRGVSLAGTF